MTTLIAKPTRLKITDIHFNQLQVAVNKVIADNPTLVERYRNGDFPRVQTVKDLQRRFGFDVLYAAKVRDLVSEIYEYANDDHIYSALKAILPKVEFNQ